MGDAACAKRLLQEVTFSARRKPFFKYTRAVAHHFYRKSCIGEFEIRNLAHTNEPSYSMLSWELRHRWISVIFREDTRQYLILTRQSERLLERTHDGRIDPRRIP